MKNRSITLLLFGVFTLILPFISAFRPAVELTANSKSLAIHIGRIDLKMEVFEILKSKCNVCHRKQNPFKIFSLKNMDKNAPKIYQQVFVKRRMPKGDQYILTEEELLKIEEWLTSKNLF